MSEHGTCSRYVRGCRCDACREAIRLYRAKRVVERRAYVEAYGLPLSVRHGSSAYQNWACRCEVCTAAWSKYMAARR